MNIAMFAAITLVCADGASLIPAMALQTAAVEPENKTDTANAVVLAQAAVEAAQAPTPDTTDQGLDEIDNAEDIDVASVELAFPGQSDEAVIARLINSLEEVSTLEGDFSQISPSGAVSTGKLYLRRPGFLRFEYEPPTPLLIVANGGIVYVRDEALETTDSYPVGKTPLKFLLRKKIDRDDAQIIRIDRGIDSVAVTFASDEEETEGELTIIVRGEAMELDRWIIRDLQGGSTVVNLENVEYGGKLATRLFAVPDAGGIFLKN